ncbi:MAG: hypothetical protein IJZ85_12630 [Lachnospiraceae bacterium]|nr:hypothetical protein [Lachnospiraceae bacterium]
MKIYGADICIDCRNLKHVMKSRGLALEYIEITENTLALREFLALRDHSEAFDHCKERGGIGIPCFVEGERVTLDMDEAFSWIGQPPVQEDEIVERWTPPV